MGEMISLITERDRRILGHFEKYKFATIDQVRKIFFRHEMNGYNLARRRLAELVKAGYIKFEHNPAINGLVYLLNERGVKMPTLHRIILLNVLANLYYYGFDVREFTLEKSWLDGKIRSDAFTVFNLVTPDGLKIRYRYFVEVNITHNPPNLEKYEKLYETGEVQKTIPGERFPRVMLITDANPTIELPHVKAVILPTNLDKFVVIALPST